MQKNPIAAMIVAKKGALAPADDVEGAEPEGNEEGMAAAADDIFAAIDKRDSAGLAQAIKALVEMC